VTVLTSQYHAALPRRDRMDGVRVLRVPVAGRVSKGVLMPSLPLYGLRWIPRHDVLHLHVPQFDAGYLAAMGRLFGKPVVLTYHCDLRLPASPINQLAGLVSRAVDFLSAALAHVVVTNTREYAEQSALLRRYLGKLAVVAPPVELATVPAGTEEAMRARLGLEPGDRVIGMVARLATEKGAEVLARALPEVLRRFPRARVLYVGQYRDVLGEEAYARRLEPILRELGDHWRFLGVLGDAELAGFYRLSEVTVLPSLNSTESFGMVQAESMASGTPVVASDLPGVRRVVAETGMGLTVPPGDPQALAEAICLVLEAPDRFRQDATGVQRRFSSARAAEQYEDVFRTLVRVDSPA
jgi:glycosyltransferase involved in cell wall biosynthesis